MKGGNMARTDTTSKTTSPMSRRERIMAAIERKPVDRIPFVPLIDTYTLLDMAPEIKKVIPTERKNDSYWRGMLPAHRMIGCDIMLRHVPVYEPMAQNSAYVEGYGRFDETVTVTSKFEAARLYEKLETPLGSVDATWGFTGSEGWIPHPMKHLVNDGEELKIFHYAIEHLSAELPEPDFDNFLAAEAAVGEDGIATTSFHNTPIMQLIESWWGLENTYYLLQDYREIVDDILKRMQQSQLRFVEALTRSPAKVIVNYENTSSTLLSPDIFKKYCLPCLNEYARVLRAADKIYLVHMCGKLHAFVDDFNRGEFEGITDISPPPTGDLPIDTAAELLPNKTIVGGIDPTRFIDRDTESLERYITELLQRLRSYPGMLLGSADTAPRGTPIENFRLIQRLAESVGA